MENHSTLSSKEIKKFILDSKNDLEEVIDFIEQDYKNSIEGIFNALFSLFRNYQQNKSRVQYLIGILEQLLEVKSVEELRMMSGPIIDFNNKISLWKLKQRISVSEPFQQIQNILNQINHKQITEIHNEKVKYLSFLIFQDKNLKMIEHFINNTNNLLNSRNEDGDNIFGMILRKYLFLDEKDREEISYFYQVILLFVSSKYEKIILRDSKQYFRLIKRSKLEYKEHIIKVMELFDPEFAISYEELEQRYPVKFQFPSIIMEEMNTFRMDALNRYDFTNQDCITIDGRDATCLDDAIYIEKNEDGTYELYIHIVDIPSFVPFSSLTNEEARERGETLYLRDRNILLYPDYISNQICSLLPNNYRNVLTYIFRLDPKFQLIENYFHLVKGKIMVKHRMSYDEVDKRILNSEGEKLDNILSYLFYFSVERRKSNQEKEKYRQLQNAIDFNPNRESLKIDYSPAANIVHESMILVNYSVPKYFHDLSLPYIYRKLELPSEDFIDEQLNKLVKLESKFVGSAEFLHQLRESYAKPQYTVVPTYHKGLQLPYYSHSSSPARRYSDSYGQYMIYDMLFDGNVDDFNLKAWEYRTIQVVNYLNKKKDMNEVFSSHYNYLSYKKLIKAKK